MHHDDDRLTEIFRVVYQRFNTSAPEAPSWPTIPKPGLDRAHRWWKGASIALAAATAVILLIGMVAIYAPKLGQEAAPGGQEAAPGGQEAAPGGQEAAPGGQEVAPVSQPKEGAVVAVYLADDIGADRRQRLIDSLTAQPDVIDWRYVDKAQANEEALVLFADDESLLRVLNDNPDLMPASILLLTRNQAAAMAIEALVVTNQPTNGAAGTARYDGTLWSAPPGIAMPGSNSYVNDEHGFEIEYPANWYLADEILAPALTSPPQRIEEVLSLGTYPLRPGASRCPNIPENALLDLGPEDVLISIVLGDGSGDAPWPDAFGPDSFLPVDVPIDAQTCIGQPDLDARTGSFNLDDRSVQVFVAFGKFATPEKRLQTWQILDSFTWTSLRWEATSTTTATAPPAACPATIPSQPGFEPPDRYPSTPVFGVWYGTDGLWTVLEVDGSYRPRMTVFWSVNFPGGAEEEQPRVDVTWTRVDVLGEPISNEGMATNAYTPEDGDFMIAGIDPDEPGCWEVTATYKGATLAYVYLVPWPPTGRSE